VVQNVHHGGCLYPWGGQTILASPFSETLSSVSPPLPLPLPHTLYVILCDASIIIIVLALPSPPPLQVIWTFSIYLEAVAILPQLVLLQRTQNIDNLTGNYVFLLG
jgi:hypothetical protein